jgi:uncharacterized iron-regulated protein
MRTVVGLLVTLMLAGCAPIPNRAGSAPRPSETVQTAHLRVVESATGQTRSFADLIRAASRADVVFFGEQHDDTETHYAEFALLEGIGRERPNVVLSLEMFERDVQDALDEYLGGRMREADFLARSRPWERYATDYRPMILLARARGWPVVAANVPRTIASAVSRRGLAALDTLPAALRAHVARDIRCAHDAYFAKFAETMKDHSTGPPASGSDTAGAGAIVQRYYEAQCIKDETMGESIVRARERAGKDAIVVHFNGAFHSDGGLGTAERARRRAPGVRSIVISAIPMVDIRMEPTADERARADYVVLTAKARQ